MASKPSTCPDDNSSAIEKRGFTTMKDHKFRYTWKINKFSRCQKKVGEPIESPQFSFEADGKMLWVLTLYPSGDWNAEKHVSIYLQLLSEVIGAGIKVVDKVCILSKNGEESNAAVDHEGSIYTPKNHTWGHPEFIEIDYLLQEKRDSLLPNDTLTIIYDITVFNGTESQPGAEFHVPQCQLSSDMGDLFENPKFTDIKLIVGSEELHAHKNILAARSPVFAAMFENEMVERQKNEVEIVDVSHEIVTELLRFIYTGTVKNLRGVAEDLIAAADKYALQRLKIMCEEELYASLTIENAAKVLIIADRHSSIELRKQAMNFIVHHATNVIQTASYEKILTIPLLIKDVVQAIVSENSKPRSDSGTTDGESGGTATSQK